MMFMSVEGLFFGDEHERHDLAHARIHASLVYNERAHGNTRQDGESANRGLI